MTQTLPRTELRIARSALSGLRQDLIDDAFAIRPLPPLSSGHPLMRRAPERARRYVGWLPHAALSACAFYVMAQSVFLVDNDMSLVLALLSGVPLLLTLFRPVGAWWLSFGASATTGLGLLGLDQTVGWPWPIPLAISHVLVMVVVAARSRPRAATEIWLLTALLAAVAEYVDADSRYTSDSLQMLADSRITSDSVQMLFVSGLVLCAVVTARTLRESKRRIAVQESVTVEERSRRTTLEERATIARELHDVVAHHMSVIAIQAEAAPYRVENPPEELTRSFATIRENAVIALTELRRVLGVVRADDIDMDADPEAPQPTLAALEGLFAGVRAAGLTVDYVTTGAVRPLPQGVELSAYRIVQEALSNALRHAPGSTARVEVSHVLGGLGLRIVNGPPTKAVPPSPGMGHGLLGMRERVAMLDGEIRAGAREEDGGYEVTVFIPAPETAVTETSVRETAVPETAAEPEA
ncbi:sensor histidine kinase [Streptomyces botrytidirepellens]|uniref:histidine kinase n=1 Tax=Streptomyces botrytidirepellens TaxID=2486417 RepID=A0A3M8UVM1_9ACTN|nr:histidine kinase [Streptomyces botrytidirepellens]RNG08205.1 two-component sensor histidine kinase [Streptomyces botrytidirepellens]